MKTLALLALVIATACTADIDDSDPGSEDSDITYCRPKQVDTNGDGVADGLDINCDGKLDVPYEGGTTSNQCSTMISKNGQSQAITCTGDGSTASCECRVDGSLVKTCSQASASCSIGYPGANCCGF
jgi:hypothetical protein